MALGLSPLARRNRSKCISQSAHAGPISARAEEPTSRRRPQCANRAYLRSRGGTAGERISNRALRGLSPLARRNLKRLWWLRQQRGPISARAEEPLHCAAARPQVTAYLRSRGGTRLPCLCSAVARGLSPLARRNLEQTMESSRPMGPISARAEEPCMVFWPNDR